MATPCWTSSSCFSCWSLPLIVVFFGLGRIGRIAVGVSTIWAYLRYVICCIYDTTATQLLSNTTRFPHGTLERRDIGTPSRSTGTLEPRDIGTPSKKKCTSWGKGTDPENRQRGTDPRNGLKWFRYPPWQSPAVSPLRVSLPSCSWRLRRPG